MRFDSGKQEQVILMYIYRATPNYVPYSIQNLYGTLNCRDDLYENLAEEERLMPFRIRIFSITLFRTEPS